MALHIIHANKNSEVSVHSENMTWVHNQLDHIDDEDPISTKEMECDYYCVSANNKILPINRDNNESINHTRKSYTQSHERIYSVA